MPLVCCCSPPLHHRLICEQIDQSFGASSSFFSLDLVASMSVAIALRRSMTHAARSSIYNRIVQSSITSSRWASSPSAYRLPMINQSRRLMTTTSRPMMNASSPSSLLSSPIIDRPQFHTCYLSIGSNIGNRAYQLSSAIASLNRYDPSRLSVHATSLMYETTPVGAPESHRGQRLFVNAAIEVRTSMTPIELLDACQHVERTHGRPSSDDRDPNVERNGPRTIDIDIIFYSSERFAYSDARLIVPHPRWSVRGFVLRPLMDLAHTNDAVHSILSLFPASVDDTDNEYRSSTSYVAIANEWHAWVGNQGRIRDPTWNDPVPFPNHVQLAEPSNEVEDMYRVIPFTTATSSHPDRHCDDTWRYGRNIAVAELNRRAAVDPDNAGAIPPYSRFASSSSSSSSLEFPRTILNRTRIMGILNVTPDSFSDGGDHTSSIASSVAHARAMYDDGADMIDIGGESTRPNAVAVSIEEELARVLPVIDAIRSAHPHIKLSIDTYHPSVAVAAVRHGCVMINDVTGGRASHDDGHDAQGRTMHQVAAELNVPYVCMDMYNSPNTMMTAVNAENRMRDQTYQFRSAMTTRVPMYEASILPASSSSSHPVVPSSFLYSWNYIRDPGVGFAHRGASALQLLRSRTPIYTFDTRDVFDGPVLVGTSRKGFITNVIDKARREEEERKRGETNGKDDNNKIISSSPSASAVDARIWSSSVTVTASIAYGADIIRVHDVKEMRHVRDMADQIYK